MSIINPISPSLINTTSSMTAFSTSPSSDAPSAATLDALMSAAIDKGDALGMHKPQGMMAFSTSPAPGGSSDGILTAFTSMAVQLDKSDRVRKQWISKLDPTNQAHALIQTHFRNENSANLGAFKKGMTALETALQKTISPS